MKYRDMTAEQKEALKAQIKQYCEEHPEEYNARMKQYSAKDLNKNGTPKNLIRMASERILEKSHAKLPGYQLHHCFGYEDPKKFIYIPKSLHLQIHRLLRDKKIPADSDHWMAIRDLYDELCVS